MGSRKYRGRCPLCPGCFKRQVITGVEKDHREPLLGQEEPKLGSCPADTAESVRWRLSSQRTPPCPKARGLRGGRNRHSLPTSSSLPRGPWTPRRPSPAFPANGLLPAPARGLRGGRHRQSGDAQVSGRAWSGTQSLRGGRVCVPTPPARKTRF